MEKGFVARFVYAAANRRAIMHNPKSTSTTAIPSSNDCGSHAEVLIDEDKLVDDWRFAGSPNRKVADAYHWHCGTCNRTTPFVVCGVARRYDASEQPCNQT
jgi:hypothetical protein